MDKPKGLRTCLYDAAQLNVVLEDMARQIAGLLARRDRVAVIGILRRGAPLADRITEILVREYSLAPPVRLNLDIKRYADDLTLLYPETRLNTHELAGLDLRGHTLLVVDDVLYTGHSLLRAVTFLANMAPDEIRVAVLVDRGATLLPIRTDVVGIRLDVAPPDVIECNIPPYEAQLKIDLLQLQA